MLDIAEKQAFDLRFEQIRAIRPGSLLEPSRRSSADIRQMGVGGVIRLGRNTYRVVRLARLDEVDDDWQPMKKPYQVTEFTLFCLESGETHYLEWEVDDELLLSFTQKKLTRAELKKGMTYDDGEVVDISDIDEIAENKWEVVFQGKTYYYDDDWNAAYQPGDGGDSFVYLLEMADEAERSYLTIEAWNDRPQREKGWEYDAYVSAPVSPSAIEVLALS